MSHCRASTARNVVIVSIAHYHWTAAALRVRFLRDGSATERELLARHHSLSTEVQVLLASLGGLLGTW